MKSAMKVSSWLVNLLTVVLALYVSLVLGHRLLAGKNLPHASRSLQPKSSISLPDTNWAANQATFVMALSTTCHFCKESVGFYKSLLGDLPAGAFHAVAVFPESLTDARNYLASTGLDIQDVRHGDLASLGVTGTPTLVLVDHTGHVVSSWVGRLSSAQEKELFGALHSGTRTTTPSRRAEQVASSGIVTAEQFQELLHANPNLPVIDVRDRPDYQRGHLAGAVNIPVDEFEERAPREIPANTPIAVYCHYCPPCEIKKAEQGSTTLCTAAASGLRLNGYSSFRLVGDDLEHLKRAGLTIDGQIKER